MFEVDLPYFKTLTHRYSQAELPHGILLPIEDAQGKHTFHVAVSHVRWSWKTIHLMGGLHPEDQRFDRSQRMPIEPDAELIKKRLQPIDIHHLINQGESCIQLDPSQTQNAKIRTVHRGEPPASNLEWVVDRDKLEHTDGTSIYQQDTYWDTQFNGSAIVLLQDPLGRLIHTSEFMVTEYCAYFGDIQPSQAYVIGNLAGKILTSPIIQGKNYEKHIDNDGRLAFMKEFEEKRESYQAMMLESTALLTHWFEAAFERGQWEDYDCNCSDTSEIPGTALLYGQAMENIYAAFMLSQEGVKYLQEAIKTTHNQIEILLEKQVTWLQREYVGSLFNNSLNLMAGILEPNEANLTKISDFYQKVTGTPLNASFTQISEFDLISHHQKAMLESANTSSMNLRVHNGTVLRHQIIFPVGTPGKTVKLLSFETKPLYRYQPLSPTLAYPLAEQELIELKKLEPKLKRTQAPLRMGLGALVIFDTRNVLAQIETKKTQGDLEEGILTVLHAEILRNSLLASELMVGGAGLMTKKIASRRVAQTTTTLAKRLCFGTVMIGMIADIWHIRNYSFTGETELARSHTLSFGSGIFTLLSLLSRSILFMGFFGILGIFLGVISAFAILYFTKNAIESWLFQGYWGLTQDTKDTPEHSVNKFHLMIPLVRLDSIEDNDGSIPLEAGRKWYTPQAMPSTEITWLLHLPSDFNVLLKITLLAHTPQGEFKIDQGEIKLDLPVVCAQGLSCKLRAPRRYFADQGLLGRILIQSYELSSGAFIGKDAYEFQYHRIENTFTHNKVLYE